MYLKNNRPLTYTSHAKVVSLSFAQSAFLYCLYMSWAIK